MTSPGSAGARLPSAANLSGVIDRYALAEMRDVFSTSARLRRWLEVELLIVDAWADLGRIPAGAAERVRRAAPTIDDRFAAAVAERELETRHDVVAFVDVLADAVGEDGRWIHYGVTSSDIVDTALGVALGRAADLVVEATCALFDGLAQQARRYRHLPMIGRTHGVHAEPITVGAKLGLLALQVSRAAQAVATAADEARVGKVSGAVGTFSHVDPRVEEYVCRALDLRPIASSQIVPRDLHAALVFAFARTVTSIEAVALQVRLGHQTEVAEIREGFAPGQKGSSAMPHKANAATAEQLCGLARLARAAVTPALEDVALWHERDLSHSSVERVVLPDISSITHYAASTATRLVSNWVVDEAHIQENLRESIDLISSQALLLALVDAGHSRDVAYRHIQSAISSAGRNGTTLSDEVQAAEFGLPQEVATAALDIDRMLEHAGRAVDELDDAWAAQRS